MRKGLIIMVLAGLTTVAFGSIRYHAADLTKVAGDSCAPIIPVTPYGINDSGMITGMGYPPDNINAKPFLYNPATGVFINVGNLAGDFNNNGYGGTGYAINNLGFITGRDSDSNTSWAYKAFIFGDVNNNGVVDSGELINLNPDGGINVGDGINIHNQVIGYNQTSTPTTGWVWTDFNGNYQYDNGERQSFGTLVPNSINDSHQIVLYGGGQSILWNDSNGNGIYENGEQQTMPKPAGYSGMSAQHIKNSGNICGNVTNSSTSKSQAFYWTDNNHNGLVEVNEYTIFGTTQRNTYTRAMNNRSEIVGGTFEWDPANTTRAAYVWRAADGMVNLNDATDKYYEADPNWGAVWFSQAEGINNNGVIVTAGLYNTYDSNGIIHHGMAVYVLTPYMPGDIDGSGRVNFKDYNILATNYGNTNCSQSNGYCSGADLNTNGKVDFADIELLTENWLLDN
jgi:hypothetical protein